MAMLPDKDEFISQMKRLGIKKNHTIVIYDYEKILVSPRISWMLRTYGAKDVRILNGCLKKWIDEGREIRRGELEDINDTADDGYNYEFNPTMKINLRPMLKKIYAKQGTSFCSHFIVEEGREDVQFFDSRGKEDFEMGHPPEFVSLPFITILDNESSFKSLEDLRKIMDEYNISTEKETIISCRRGVTA
jgi:thiosulfate/3-mercaptopyruvate sulfurtransferase